MTTQQALSFAIVGGMLVLFLWDRLRYDVVAALALTASVAVGVVKPDKAFEGFANPVIMIIATALVLSRAIAGTGLIEMLTRRLEPAMRTRGLQVGVLVFLVTLLSAFMKNVGALAMFLPVAFQVARRNGRSVAEFLMPMAFGSLIGGTVTLIGTSPNLLISAVRQQTEGKPFGMFDFTPVGLGVCVAGVLFLGVGWRLVPKGRRPSGPAEERFRIEDYMTEATVPPGSPFVGKQVRELEALGEGDLTVAAIVRERFRRYVPAGHWTLQENDELVLEADPVVLKRVIDEAGLELEPSRGEPAEAGDGDADRLGVVEAIVNEGSALVGNSPEGLQLRQRYGVNLLAVSRHGRRNMSRLRRLRFQTGDVVVLQGDAERLDETVTALGCIPLAERNLRLGRPRQRWLPLAILVVAMALAATNTVPVAMAFFGGAVAIAVFRVLPLREIYESIDWPILVLLGCMIPVGESVHATGGTELIAGWIAGAAGSLPPWGLLALVMAISMVATPILHHAAAVLVMGPIAASLGAKLGMSPDPFMMAVALGAASDFLTPVGHQCNTLVMGPGGYKFGDYWRVGLPLSAIVLIVGVPLIVLVWPLR